MTHLHRLKIKVTVQGHGFYPWISFPLFVSWILWKIFIILWSKCLSVWDDVQSSWLNYPDSRSKSHFKVMGFTLEFGVRSISPQPFERFSLKFTQMFSSVRLCAESMTQLPRRKVKVTLKGHRIYPWTLCPLHISWTLWMVFIKLYSDVTLYTEMDWSNW